MDRNENLSHVEMFHRLLGGRPTRSLIGFRTHTQCSCRGRGRCFCCTGEGESLSENNWTGMGSLRNYRVVGKHYNAHGNIPLIRVLIGLVWCRHCLGRKSKAGLRVVRQWTSIYRSDRPYRTCKYSLKMKSTLSVTADGEF